MLPRMRKKPRKEPGLKKPGRPLRSPSHRAWVRRHVCCVPVCGDERVEAHHVKTRGAGGGDEWCVSLCGWHHVGSDWSFHMMGRHSFAAYYGVDLFALAREFAAASPDPAIREAAKTMQSATPLVGAGNAPPAASPAFPSGNDGRR